jgi:hypothetical protein
MISRFEYKGYTVVDETIVVDDGRFRARIAILTLGDGRVRSQRFIDLETFQAEADARRRAVAGARAWIDAEVAQDNDRLALPTNFSPWA